jgi:pimeloyl-ACP methyl ester carboxylesterase
MELRIDGKPAFAATGGRPFDPTLPTMLFVHGAGMDHTVWALQARYFAHRGRGVLAVDLPGHGRSAGPALGSIREIADWLASLIEAAGVDRAALAGHSMGALAALDCAARYPERVRALALLGVAARMPVHPDLLAAAEADEHAAFDMINLWGHSRAAQVGGNPAPGLWRTGAGIRLLERAGPGVLHTDLKACSAYGETTEMATRVACPTVLILGARDAMTPPRGAEALCRTIPGARTVVLKQCGHMIMAEQPNEVLDTLIGFV